MSAVNVRIQTTTKKRNKTMNVKVVNNEETEITYGFSPEHFDGVSEYYNELLEKGEIQSFTIEM